MLHAVLAWSLAQVPEPPAPVDAIRWDAPPGCPGRAELVAGVERRRGEPLAPGQVRVDAVVTAEPAGRFTLTLGLVVGDHAERRSLTADRCAALVDAAALLISVAIAEHAASVPPPPDPAPEPDPAPSPILPEPELAPEPAPAPSPILPEPEPDEPRPPQRPRRSGGFVRAHGGLELGGVPGPTGAVGLAAGVLWRRARLELQPLFIAPRTTTREGRDLQVLLVALTALGCWRAGRGALEVPLCGGFEGGVMRGVASTPGETRTALGEWLAVVAQAGVAWRFRPRFGLWAAVQGTAAVRRPGFLLRGPGPEVSLFAPSPVTLRVVVGLELGFGDPR